jgi:hypothetical protein
MILVLPGKPRPFKDRERSVTNGIPSTTNGTSPPLVLGLEGLQALSTGSLRAVLPLGGAWAAAASLLLSVSQPIGNLARASITKNRYCLFGRCELAALSHISEKLLP